MNLPLLMFVVVLTLPTALRAACAPSGLLCDLLAQPEETVIADAAPRFGWIYNPSFRDDFQSAYQIIVSSDIKAIDAGVGDVWNSGWIKANRSINVPYEGKPLAAGASFFWRVRTSDSRGITSEFSQRQRIVTGTATDTFAGRYPLRFAAAIPVLVTNTGPGRWFIDFGQDAFGYAALQVRKLPAATTIQVRFGEMSDGFSVNTAPPAGSMVRYANATFSLKSGDATYTLRAPKYSHPPTAIIQKDYGVVMPFRYLELLHFPGPLASPDIVQMRLLSNFGADAASFHSSSEALDQIWRLCRNSMEMLTFDGVYVDGDRERKPYEADAYIQQMSTYAVDREFTLPRYSLEYLLQHPTWPTEWKFHDIFMAWADYLQTGDSSLLKQYYSTLQADSFTWAATESGLMKGFPNFSQTTNSDVVDWPRGDRDGFIISNGDYRNWTNSINNAFYYRSLRLMANIADVLERTNDARTYTATADRVYSAYNATFWDKAALCYTDGVGTSHASAHANFFALAFGLVPSSRQTAVVAYLHSRMSANGGMPCSVYGAQYLLEALFNSGDTDTAIGLMATNGPRSWLNMIKLGSTLTTEAWSFSDKANMDWNHAWGAAPANLIARYILGLRPITAGFGEVLIQPQLGNALNYARGVVPTIRGPVSIAASNAPGDFKLSLNIPGNVTATVMLQDVGAGTVALVDGRNRAGTLSNGWLTIKNIGAGEHEILLNKEMTPPAATLYAGRATGLSSNAANTAETGSAADGHDKNSN